MCRKQIAVFDLRPEDRTYTAGMIRKYFGDTAEVIEYGAMQEFSYAFQDRMKANQLYDMMFIGVDNFIGLETARNIREQDRENLCPMFLVSEVEDYGLEGFRLLALDYLTKPVSEERIDRAVKRIGMGSDQDRLMRWQRYLG